MQLREKVHDAISKMPTGALTLLYEQIKALEKVMYHPKREQNKKTEYSLDEIHEMTSSSKSCWSDTVIDDRQDRL